MHVLGSAELLSLWDRGTPRHALDRAVLLAATARPDWPADSIADLSLGAVGACLLRLRAANFGPHIEAHADCRRCGQRLAVALDVADLLADAPPESTTASAPPTTEVAGLRVRAPSLRDLAAVAHLTPDAAADALLTRCTLTGDSAHLDAAARAQVDEALETLDPQADLAFSMQCVGCGQQDMTQLDAGALLWDEISSRASALLNEVHQLARSYGWSEAQILALPATRRAQYLALVEGAP